MIVTGTFSIDMQKLLDRRRGWRDARDHTLAEDHRSLPPWHQAIRGRSITRGARKQVIDRSLAEVTIDIAPASRAGEGGAAAVVAIGEALDRDNPKARRGVLPALRIDQRIVEAAAGTRFSLAICAGQTSHADIQGNGDGGFGYCLFRRNVQRRLVHYKARQWMATALQRGTRPAASGPALRSTNLLTPGHPVRNG